MNETTGKDNRCVAVIGGGFCGLAAAYELCRRGIRAIVLERDPEVGGLAGSFAVGDARLEKFYHHWFTNDVHVMQIIRELDLSGRVIVRPTRTGMYYAHNFFKLSTPIDLLRFSPLPFWSRMRLGFMTLRARRVRDWRRLEDISAAEWLRKLGGERVYRVVWEPLLRGKFGDLAEEVAAVWIWNKLKLRGSSRGKAGEERLAYFDGGFSALADAMVDAVRAQGGDVKTGFAVRNLRVREGQLVGISGDREDIAVDATIITPATPVVADLIQPHASHRYVEQLRRIRYLANLCVVLELRRSLSEMYWLNVNDPKFPFVGVIEHTNFAHASAYGGRHIAYLSSYLPDTASLYNMKDPEIIDFTLDHVKRMFPDFNDDDLFATHVWRARYAQPVVECGYRRLIPDTRTPVKGLYLATMAQIYPEDRGTNYAIRQGRYAAGICASEIQ